MNFPTQSWFMTPSLGYIKKVLTPKPSIGYDPSSLIGFWPQDEKSGLVSLDHSGLGHHGVYTGVTLGEPGVPGMGMTSPFYNGAYNNIYSALLAAAFDGAEGAALTWMKVAGAGTWTDGIIRELIWIRNSATDDYVIIRRTADNNRIRFLRNSGAGVLEQINLDGQTTLGFLCLAITWSEANDEVIAYRNGVQVGVPSTGLGVFAGPIDSGFVGARNNTPDAAWFGNIGPTLLCAGIALPQPQIAYLSTP